MNRNKNLASQSNSPAPKVTGIGKDLLLKLGWKEGESLGSTNSGILEPIEVETKINRQGLTSCEEKCPGSMRKRKTKKSSKLSSTPETANSITIGQGRAAVGDCTKSIRMNIELLPFERDLCGKNPICVLNEYCQKIKVPYPTFAFVKDADMPNRVVCELIVNGMEYTGQIPLKNRKLAKTHVSVIALYDMGLIRTCPEESYWYDLEGGDGRKVNQLNNAQSKPAVENNNSTQNDAPTQRIGHPLGKLWTAQPDTKCDPLTATASQDETPSPREWSDPVASLKLACQHDRCASPQFSLIFDRDDSFMFKVVVKDRQFRGAQPLPTKKLAQAYAATIALHALAHDGDLPTPEKTANKVVPSTETTIRDTNSTAGSACDVISTAGGTRDVMKTASDGVMSNSSEAYDVITNVFDVHDVKTTASRRRHDVITNRSDAADVIPFTSVNCDVIPASLTKSEDESKSPADTPDCARKNASNLNVWSKTIATQTCADLTQQQDVVTPISSENSTPQKFSNFPSHQSGSKQRNGSSASLNSSHARGLSERQQDSVWKLLSLRKMRSKELVRDGARKLSASVESSPNKQPRQLACSFKSAGNSPHKKPAPSAGNSPHKQPAPSAGNSPHKQPAPSAGNSPYKKPPPSAGNSPYKQQAPSAGNSPHKKPAPSAGNSPYKQPAPSAGNSPHKKPAASADNSPYKQPAASAGNSPHKKPAASADNSPCKQPAPSAGNSPFKKPAPSAGNSPCKQPAPSAGNSPFNKPATSPGNSPHKKPAAAAQNAPYNQPDRALSSDNSFYKQPAVPAAYSPCKATALAGYLPHNHPAVSRGDSSLNKPDLLLFHSASSSPYKNPNRSNSNSPCERANEPVFYSARSSPYKKPDQACGNAAEKRGELENPTIPSCSRALTYAACGKPDAGRKPTEMSIEVRTRLEQLHII